MKRARGEQVFAPQQDLVVVEGLGQKIVRARRERAAPGLRGHVGGEDHHRQESALRLRGAELFEHGVTVEERHGQIEQHEVGLGFGHEPRHLARIGRAAHRGVPGAVQDRFEQGHVGGLVVHDQDVRINHGEGAAKRRRGVEQGVEGREQATGS